jgi:hypothetical protein
MQVQALKIAGWCVAILLASLLLFGAEQLPLEPKHDSGQSVTAAYEGWYKNPDGTFNILIGYYNRNLKQDLDIPVGPNNKVEPGGPDQGQPTHFLPGRQWGVFTITVPKDFGDKKLTWTISANGKTTFVPVHLDPLWVVAPFIDAENNTPPVISLDEGATTLQGPPRGIVKSLTTTLPDPLTLTVWVSDDAKVPVGALSAPRTPAATVTWSKFRGPGAVTFASNRPLAEKTEWKAPPPSVFTGKATTTATFSEPGEYILEVTSNDWSGEGGRGFQCCWTSAQVKVTVKPPAGAGF